MRTMAAAYNDLTAGSAMLKSKLKTSMLYMVLYTQ